MFSDESLSVVMKLTLTQQFTAVCSNETDFNPAVYRCL